VLLSLLAWGNRHFATQGEGVMLVDAETGEPLDPVLVDRRSGRPLDPGSYAVVPKDAAKRARATTPPPRRTSEPDDRASGK
jgi:hypothetical protein